jgi:hypothetical protein
VSPDKTIALFVFTACETSVAIRLCDWR